jgi:hypothetical protein
MVDGEKASAQEMDREEVKPYHSGRKMILSAQIVTIENSKCNFDYWLVLTSIGHKIKINISIKAHHHINQFYNWKRSTTVTIHSKYVQFSFEKETDKKLTTGKNVGINHLLATSDKE